MRWQAALLHFMQDAICVLGLDHTVLYWNKSAEGLYGWTPDEVLDQDARTLLFEDAAAGYAEARATVLADGAWAGEQCHRSRSRSELVVQSRWTLVPEAEDETGTILIVNTDMTERRQLEAQFLRAQRLESLGTLAGGIAHDINNILGPILMSIQLLKRKITDERSQDLLDTLEASALRGGDILTQILSFARGMDGERRVLQLEQLVSEVGRILKDILPPSITVETDIADDLGVIEGDATQLHQVLMNLCVNARDAMPSGGALQIEAANVDVDAAYARRCVNGQPGSYVRVRVTDTGVGMPPEVADKITNPFLRPRIQVKGLGFPPPLVSSRATAASWMSKAGKALAHALMFSYPSLRRLRLRRR
jgi:PAS domain S-box-containing protein